MRIVWLALVSLALDAGFVNADMTSVQSTFQASDGTTIGFYHQRGEIPTAPTVFMLPGFTLTAEGYMRWFAEQFAGVGFDVVCMDYRGFGLSLGNFIHSASPLTEHIYRGLRMSRFAMDAHEVMGQLGLKPERVLLMAHRIGVHVASEYISLFDPLLLGYIILDQPPSFTDLLQAAEASFDDVDSEEKPPQIEDCLRKFNGLINYTETPVEIVVHTGLSQSKRFFWYPNLVAFFNSAFRAVEDGYAANGYATYTNAALVEWKSLTSFYSDMNGKLVGLTMGRSHLQDYTDVYRVIAERAYPCFVYGGNASLGSLSAMEWIWRQLEGSNPLSQSLFWRDGFGVHTPWLNPQPSAGRFYDNLTHWASRVLEASTMARKKILPEALAV